MTNQATLALHTSLEHKNLAVAEIGAMLLKQAAQIVDIEQRNKKLHMELLQAQSDAARAAERLHAQTVEIGVLTNTRDQLRQEPLQAQAGAAAVAIEEPCRQLRLEQSRVENLERIVRARDEGVAYLRGEVAEKLRRNVRLEKEVASAHKATAKLAKQLERQRKEHDKKIRQMESNKLWKLRKALRGLKKVGNPLRHPKNILRAVGLVPWKSGPEKTTTPSSPVKTSQKNSTSLPVVALSPPTPVLAAPQDRNEKLKSYGAQTILPHLSSHSHEDIINRVQPQIAPSGVDVISFSIVDWEFRFQRPQQVMAEFAAQGHRIFYISVSRFHPADARPRFTARELRPNVYEVSLAGERAPDVYGEVIGGNNADALLASLGELRRAFHIEDAVSYVTVASWTSLALATRHRWGWRVLYDCMDEWEDFDVIHPVIVEAESKLVAECSLLVVTARRLQEKWEKRGRHALLARNAVDYDFYAQTCRPNTLLEGLPYPIIGYYGGIADWFDVELMLHAARAHPEWTFVLVGGVFDVDVSELAALPNVRLLGQQPYETMPLYLYHFDVCIIPFKINAITEATDPVKFYEYISWGKPVVSTMLPELEPYRDHLYLARDKEDFVIQIGAALAEDDPTLIARRRALAREHTWSERVTTIKAGISGITPCATIIIVTYNCLALTKLCLESVLRNTSHANHEIIVVDNHSQDGTPAYLSHMAGRHPHIRIILNPANRGFAAANNQGLAAARGEHLVLLNNDTIVPPGWLQRLLRHLQDLTVGLVGPVTNFVGNEARLECSYQTIAEMEVFAQQHTWEHDGEAAEISMLAMFCVALRRDTMEKVGLLDEDFGTGMFEDDDYAVRMRKAGLKVLCAADVFVHHFGQAAFGKLIQTGDYDPLFERNQRLFETKWGVAWRAHTQGPLDFSSRF